MGALPHQAEHWYDARAGANGDDSVVLLASTDGCAVGPDDVDRDLAPRERLEQWRVRQPRRPRAAALLYDLNEERELVVKRAGPNAKRMPRIVDWRAGRGSSVRLQQGTRGPLPLSRV